MKKIKIASFFSLLFFFSFAFALNPPELPAQFKAAAVEFNPKFGEFAKNLPALQAAVEEAAKAGAKLIVLPEMATSGYIYKDQAQIKPFLDTIPGKTTALLEPIAKKYHVYIAVGIGEIDPQSQLLYNSAALIGPKGYIGKYRKNYLNSADQRWATPGNLGFPVFDTELGKIALLICYDDTYSHSFLLPAVRGANVIAYLTASDQIPFAQKGFEFNHSTIAGVAPLAGWFGTYIVGSSRTGLETNPVTGLVTNFVGGASIWDPNGNKLAQAGVSTVTHPLAPKIIYAEIDTRLYQNSAKEVLATRRRPSLYAVNNLSREPVNLSASTEFHWVRAAIVQYNPVNGDPKANWQTVTHMLAQAETPETNLILFPENSLLGNMQITASNINQVAEPLDGATTKLMITLAKQYHAYVAYSFPSKQNNKFYETAVLLNPEGELNGFYHKSHLNAQEKTWATAGDHLPVFNTRIGRIAFMLGDEVRIPDIANVYSTKRADIILVPTSWAGQYGKPVEVDPMLLAKPFPEDTMTMWYNVARYAQAYTLIANYINLPAADAKKSQTESVPPKDIGGSGLYSLDPVEGRYPPEVAPNKSEVFHVYFRTLGSSNWWLNQNYLMLGQRVSFNPPLSLPYDSSCFKDWVKNTTGNNFCWDH